MRQIWATLPQTLARLFQSDRVFAGLLALCYVFYLTPAGTNTLSRYDMVYALAQRDEIIEAVKAVGYSDVTIDPGGLRHGSMNEGLKNLG